MQSQKSNFRQMKTMYHYAVLGLLCLTTLTFIADGRVVQEDAVCRKEHGQCTLDMYENVRLLAQRSSGCRNFCQCAHASTQLDGTYTYMWVKHECPLGTLFDETLPAPVCNHEFLVKCDGAAGEDECQKEHGECTKFTYEYIRLVALKSSGCAEFCQCEHASTQLDGSVTYRWAKQVCPAGTLFDERLPAPVCNHANQVQCSGNNNTGGIDNGGTGNGGTVDNGNENSNGAGGDGGENSNGDAECQAEHGVCSQNTYENIRLLALKSSGCAEFCQCEHASTQSDGSVTYRWAKQVCPPGTLFDENLPTPVCNHASQVQCNVNNDEDECEQEHGECSKYTYENIRLVALRSSGCAEFCQCEHASTQLDGSVTYRWAKQSCPAGTLFDESLPAPVCNHANQVQCNGNNNNGDTDNGETENVDNDNGNGNTNGNTGEGDDGGEGGDGDGGEGGDGDGGDGGDGDGECHKEHGVCNQYTYENIRLLALKSSGCAEFCQCEHASTQSDGSVTYRWAKQVCPPGTLFDENLPTPVCNHASQVQCNVNNDEDECKQEHGECSKYTYENIRLVALKSSGCAEFCQCEHASTQLDGSVTYKWAKQSCPAGTLFDESLPAPVCNHANQVQCNENNNGNTDTPGADNGAGDNNSDGSNNGGGGDNNGDGSEGGGNGNDDDDCEREHGVCNQYTYENVRLVALKSSDCSEFCQCEYASTQWDGSVTYRWAKHSCPAGTLFDESLPTPVCNHASLVQCKDNDEEEDCEREHGTCSQSTYENIRLVALKSSGCAEFCQCEFASTQWDGSVTYKWAKHVCPAGTLFDESLPAPVCNYAYQVQCDGDENGSNGNGGADSESNNNDASSNSDSESGSDNDSDNDSKETGNDTSGSDTKSKSDTDNNSNDNESDSKESSDGNNNNGENGNEEHSSKTVDSGNDSTNNEDSSKSKGESAKSSKSKSNSKSDKSSTKSSSKSSSKSSKSKSKSSNKTNNSDDDNSTKNSDSKSKSDSNDSKSKSKSEKSKSKSGSSNKSKSSKSNDDSSSKDSDKETKSSNSKSDKGSKSKSTKSSKSKSKSGKSSGSKSKTESSKDFDDVEAEDELQEVIKPMQCYTCHKEFSNVLCNEETEVCSHNKQSCQTIVEWRDDRYEVRKGCKNPTANTANAKLECKKTGSKILCRYECRDNLCNEPLPPIDLDG